MCWPTASTLLVSGCGELRDKPRIRDDVFDPRLTMGQAVGVSDESQLQSHAYPHLIVQANRSMGEACGCAISIAANRAWTETNLRQVLLEID